jgi:kelch-like protein 18
MSIRRSRVGVAVLRNKLYGNIFFNIKSIKDFLNTLIILAIAIGGYNGSERLNTVEILDGSKRAWSRIASMSCKRSAVGAAALQDRLYVCGGNDDISCQQFISFVIKICFIRIKMN